MIIICKKYGKYFDLLCFTCQISLNFFYLVIALLKLNSGGLKDYDFYESGFAMAYFSFRYFLFIFTYLLSFNLGSKFILKLIPIIINILSLLLHYALKFNDFSLFNLTLILGGVMTAT